MLACCDWKPPRAEHGAVNRSSRLDCRRLSSLVGGVQSQGIAGTFLLRLMQSAPATVCMLHERRVDPIAVIRFELEKERYIPYFMPFATQPWFSQWPAALV